MQISPITVLDISKVKQVLLDNSHLNDSKEILLSLINSVRHSNSLCLKITNTKGKILGIWVSTSTKEYTLLTYLYIDPSIRYTKLFAKFYLYCLNNIPQYLPLLVNTLYTNNFITNKFKLLEDNVYYLKKRK